jgi:hypothetical protein
MEIPELGECSRSICKGGADVAIIYIMTPEKLQSRWRKRAAVVF